MQYVLPKGAINTSMLTFSKNDEARNLHLACFTGKTGELGPPPLALPTNSQCLPQAYIHVYILQCPSLQPQ